MIEQAALHLEVRKLLPFLREPDGHRELVALVEEAQHLEAGVLSVIIRARAVHEGAGFGGALGDVEVSVLGGVFVEGCLPRALEVDGVE